jgi:hypothetical protein
MACAWWLEVRPICRQGRRGEGGGGSGPAVLLAHNKVPAREPSRAAPLTGAANAGVLARAHRRPMALRSLVVLTQAGPW